MAATEGRHLVEANWLYTGRAERLHHATLNDAQYTEILDGQLEEETITATCGRRLTWPMIPGVLSRMGMPRCTRCCTRIGYPQGIGSPKNDPGCQR